jgi:hypothetical protein
VYCADPCCHKIVETPNEAHLPILEDIVIPAVQLLVVEMGIPLGDGDIFVTGELLGQLQVPA